MTRFLASAAALACALLFVAAAAHAGPGCDSDPLAAVERMFEQADRDADGALTRAEYESAGLADMGVDFAGSDLDADGRTTLREYLELYERIHRDPTGLEV